MIELAGAVLAAVLVLVYLGQFAVVLALLFGALLAGAAGTLIYFLRLTPSEVSWGIVAGAVVIGTIYREASNEAKRDVRAPQRSD